MVQKSFSFLGKYLVSLNCPSCGLEHFDRDELAFKPHKVHECEHCAFVFEDKSRYKGVVSNPIVQKFKILEQNFAQLEFN